MRTKRWGLALGTLGLGLFMQACSEDAVSPLMPDSVGPRLAIGDVEATKTAFPYWKRVTTHDWTLSQTASPSSLTLAQGASGSVQFTVSAVKTATGTTDVFGMTGEICVDNTSGVATTDLSVEDTFFGPVDRIVDLVLDVSGNPVLDPGESHCYPYSMVMPADFVLVPAGPYGNKGYVYGTQIIDGVSHRVRLTETARVDVTWPSSPTADLQDESLVVSDAVACPAGFTCTPGSGNWTFNSSGSNTLAVTVKNVSACAVTRTIAATASGTENDSGQARSAGASANLTGGNCGVPQCTNLTLYWLAHTGYFAGKPDLVSPLLPIRLGAAGGAKTVNVNNAATAKQVMSLQLGSWTNGITILYAELLSVKLNIANGTDPTRINSTIAEVDAFLAANDHTRWNSLSTAGKIDVLEWAAKLAGYNVGLLGPSLCRY